MDKVDDSLHDIEDYDEDATAQEIKVKAFDRATIANTVLSNSVYRSSTINSSSLCLPSSTTRNFSDREALKYVDNIIQNGANNSQINGHGAVYSKSFIAKSQYSDLGNIENIDRNLMSQIPNCDGFSTNENGVPKRAVTFETNASSQTATDKSSDTSKRCIMNEKSNGLLAMTHQGFSKSVFGYDLSNNRIQTEMLIDKNEGDFAMRSFDSDDLTSYRSQNVATQRQNLQRIDLSLSQRQRVEDIKTKLVEPESVSKVPHSVNDVAGSEDKRSIEDTTNREYCSNAPSHRDPEITDVTPAALTKVVFSHDVRLLDRFLTKYPIDQINDKDALGNTPLLLAAKLSYRHMDFFECVQSLMEKGANPRIRDANGWSCLDEAVSQSDATLLSVLFDQLVILKKETIIKQQENFIRALESIPDFYLELKWDFESSFIPFVSKVAPSDTFRIWKFGKLIRMDNSLISFKKFKAKRREMSLIFNTDISMPENFKSCASLFSINRTRRTYTNLMQDIDYEEKRHILCDMMIANPLQGTFNIKECQWSEAKGLFKHSAHKIGDYETRKYDFKVTMEYAVFKKSPSFFIDTYESYMDKLSTPDAQSDISASNRDPKAMLAEIRAKNGVKTQQSTEKTKEIPKTKKELQENLANKTSIQKKISADVYENAQVTEKKSNASIWFAQSFPLKLKDLLRAIQFLSKGNDLLQKMESLLSRQEVKEMNPGDAFPMKFQLPITMSIKANITVAKYEALKSLNCAEIFSVPEGFEYMSRRETQKTLTSKNKRAFVTNLLT